MLSKQDNELLCRVGPGTPMGELMREYWIPACASNELKPDGPPMRLLLLNEKLLAFRDTNGRVGIVDHQCAHRCASLFFGRNEGNGIRCVYHGWKFDVNGNCLDMPNVPPGHSFADRVKIKAYKTFEHNGLVWVYMGKREKAPILPSLEPMFLPTDEVEVGFVQRDCNWLQGLEGEIDTSHYAFLHLGSVKEDDVAPDSMHKFALRNRAPEYYTAETEWGTMYAAHRPAEAGELFMRYAHFLFPFFTMVPDGSFDDHIVFNAWVPMDDEHTMATYVVWKKRTLALRELKDGRPIPGLEQYNTVPYLPNSADWYGRFRPELNASNDYKINREAQRTSSYSGLPSLGIQDQAIIESMGPIVDRSKEHLALSDRMISVTRRRLLSAVKAYGSTGELPPGVDNPTSYHGARSGSFVARDGEGWMEMYSSQLINAKRAFSEVDLDPNHLSHAAQ
ncbi:Rieske 2Fe-2S domain-containing protein [Bradyrhizobium sp. BR13661]|jgi:phthalate 4,5-dioxygenase oxygenase subunit|uniref:Rieske 2Fe-2S domain-containing protein n=1 Tax=Bradyrhizobium sp. BR13661 TaxID=2940622 RepID=UPI0024754380|nr:Rieske 2Fe-2S domain-containing protein [Bradyrhizobium sp. BR13661]MDH6261812.1 phthalate 4,5-dioxygenase oxygenase subunit [Bradyrhizobium sp. BR13661]